MFGILGHGEQRVEGNTYLHKMGIDGLSPEGGLCTANVAHIFYSDLEHGKLKLSAFLELCLAVCSHFFRSENL